jgi:hypothetical protein
VIENPILMSDFKIELSNPANHVQFKTNTYYYIIINVECV